MLGVEDPEFQAALTRILKEKRVFVSGSDTDIGKTLVCGILATGWNAHYWKPVQSGTETVTDSETVASWIGAHRIFPERYILGKPLSPNQSAEFDGISMNLRDFQLPPVEGPLIVEGAGGLMVPINDQSMMIDLAAQLQLPIILTVRTGLGTINHTLLSIQVLKQRCLPLAGVIFSGQPHPDNQRDIARFGKVPILGVVPRLEKVEPSCFKELFSQWVQLADGPAE